MSHAEMQKTRPKRIGTISVLLGVGAFLFVVLAISCAGFLLYQARQIGATAGFDAFAIGALVALMGTGLTGLTSIYSATLQANTTARLGEYTAEVAKQTTTIKDTTDRNLADLKANVDRSLAEFKKNADEALTRLKISLDASQVAHRELFGCATVYFHALRAGAKGVWDSESLKNAQAAMVVVSRQLLHVEQEMRDQWFEFWQRAEDIFIEAMKEPDPERRADIAHKAILKPLEGPDDVKLNFRQLHDRLEKTAQEGAAL